jgi:hypothetical protein
MEGRAWIMDAAEPRMRLRRCVQGTNLPDNLLHDAAEDSNDGFFLGFVV